MSLERNAEPQMAVRYGKTLKNIHHVLCSNKRLIARDLNDLPCVSRS